MFGLAIGTWIRLGLAAAALAGLGWSHLAAYRHGRAVERTAIPERSLEILRERNATDDEISGMDDPALCAALGGVWVPDERRCE